MQGMQGAMLKKKYPHQDLHMNSNIMIQMDEKPRLRSQYMKKYSDELQRASKGKLKAGRRLRDLRSRPAALQCRESCFTATNVAPTLPPEIDRLS